jgi:hypothetical protein
VPRLYTFRRLPGRARAGGRKALRMAVMTEEHGHGQTAEERLERGEVLFFPACPFALPRGDDLDFLLRQRLRGRRHKKMALDPLTGRTSGFPRAEADAARLTDLLGSFGQQAASWLGGLLPRHAAAWQRDRVSLDPEEAATRPLRLSARNDLLHLDAYPNRPTQGRRVLRLFVNFNPAEQRVCVTSDTFPTLLERYGAEAGLPTAGEDNWARHVGESVVALFRPGRRRSVYDAFMLRFHHFLKANDAFQEKCRKKLWHFPPGSAWVFFSDYVSHAVLRGRFALDHSFFVAPSGLALPQESPPVLLQRACGVPVFRQAA